MKSGAKVGAKIHEKAIKNEVRKKMNSGIVRPLKPGDAGLSLLPKDTHIHVDLNL